MRRWPRRRGWEYQVHVPLRDRPGQLPLRARVRTEGCKLLPELVLLRSYFHRSARLLLEETSAAGFHRTEFGEAPRQNTWRTWASKRALDRISGSVYRWVSLAARASCAISISLPGRPASP